VNYSRPFLKTASRHKGIPEWTLQQVPCNIFSDVDHTLQIIRHCYASMVWSEDFHRGQHKRSDRGACHWAAHQSASESHANAICLLRSRCMRATSLHEG
jgi:hypothetical protein